MGFSTAVPLTAFLQHPRWPRSCEVLRWRRLELVSKTMSVGEGGPLRDGPSGQHPAGCDSQPFPPRRREKPCAEEPTFTLVLEEPGGMWLLHFPHHACCPPGAPRLHPLNRELHPPGFPITPEPPAPDTA